MAPLCPLIHMTPLFVNAMRLWDRELNKLYLKFFSLNLWPLPNGLENIIYWWQEFYSTKDLLQTFGRATIYCRLGTAVFHRRGVWNKRRRREGKVHAKYFDSKTFVTDFSRKKCLNVPLKLKSFVPNYVILFLVFPFSGLSPKVHKTVKTSRHPRTAAFTSHRNVQQKNAGATSVNRLKAQLRRRRKKDFDSLFSAASSRQEI